MLAQSSIQLFDLIGESFLAQCIVLVEVQSVADDEIRSVLCIVSEGVDTFRLQPVALLLEDDPCSEYRPPVPGGGFLPS
ncbi:MAG: hypothetical protein JST40_12745 [Armatimonadetes bacterium]|nr:hypothetical protein [Armatimonadota bacterium]